MYFPYFRGRQYELLALKELVNSDLLSKRIIPVVEPIKLTSTFDGTLEAFSNRQNPIALIFNPAVGDYASSDSFLDVFWQKKEGITNNISPALLMNNSTATVVKALSLKDIPQSRITAVFDKRDFLDTYKKQFADTAPQYTLFPDERKFRRTVKNGKIMFKDNFYKQPKNADYPEDDFFTEDHLYFGSEGYTGFGDYSIVGNEYRESGFAPFAVAIHIVYFASDNTLRVRHFISDSNDDISDVAGKFNEAVTKLERWYKNGQDKQLTVALQTLLNYSSSGYYPGLPTIKKLSIMHHLELIGQYLDKEA